MKPIPARKAYEELEQSKAILIDVRSPAEFEEVHAKGAINTPLDKISLLLDDLREVKKPIYVICQSGNRSQNACAKLTGLKPCSIEGGTLGWMQNDLPLVRGRTSWSLERQVRLGAGSLVVAGVALGFFVSTHWYLLSAFVGAGLVFAAVTNTCGMGLLLARMPWNSKGVSVRSIRSKLQLRTRT